MSLTKEQRDAQRMAVRLLNHAIRAPRLPRASAWQQDTLPGELNDLPAKLSAIFFLITSSANRESFLGDLEERFHIEVKEKGRRAATVWFWREVIHSFFSLALDALKRLSGFEKLVERYRRIGS